MSMHSAKSGLPRYTCLMSVYAKEKPERLLEALDSIASQSYPPEEIVLVEDGPLGCELRAIIDDFNLNNPGLLKTVALRSNQGLWKALRIGVAECETDFIMRMDSDDWSVSDRAKRQLEYMSEHPDIGCCGSFVAEFEGDFGNVVSHVTLPTDHKSIVAYSKSRNPFRHPTMLYRKDAVLKAGNYCEMPYFEDYDLVLRLISSGCVLHNLSQELVFMRVDESFYQRRGDVNYLRDMVSFRRKALKRGDVNSFQFICAVVPHAVVCVMPNRLRKAVYKSLLRSRK